MTNSDDRTRRAARAPNLLASLLDDVASRAESAGASGDALRHIADQLAPPPLGPLSRDEAAALTRKLAEANGFAFDALDVNREGRLSDAQIAARGRSVRGTRMTASVIALGMTAVTIFAFVAILPRELHALLAWRGGIDEAAGHAGTIGAILLVGFAVLWASALAMGWDGSRRELAEGRVASVEGVVTRRPTPKSATGWYLVGKRSFKVNAAGYQAIVSGLRYRCYYLPRTGTLVNIEAV